MATSSKIVEVTNAEEEAGSSSLFEISNFSTLTSQFLFLFEEFRPFLFELFRFSALLEDVVDEEFVEALKNLNFVTYLKFMKLFHTVKFYVKSSLIVLGLFENLTF